jgi:NADPH:quinone reductase-like Zn-dependent oxidoreductase
VRALFTTLKIAPGKALFVEGAATGTGLEALKSATRAGLAVTGGVSSESRARFIGTQGAVGALDRTDPRFKSLYTPVPENDPAGWEAAGQPLLDEYRRQNGGRLADYVVSHAGETAFARSFQLLAEGLGTEMMEVCLPLTQSGHIIGFVIVGMFVATWLAALLIWRFGRIEQRWAATPEGSSG